MKYLLNRTSRPVIILPYQDRWVKEYAAIGHNLRTILGDRAIRIDHIGSTSVPGLSAKDVIDIQITVENIEAMDDFENMMVRRGGYRARGGYHEDHIPAGEDDNPAEWRKRYFREPEGQRRTHIHVRELGRRNQIYSLLFRDFLRENKGAAKLYELIKKRLAQLFPNTIDAYLYIKDPTIDIIMNAANTWAVHSGWQLGPSDA